MIKFLGLLALSVFLSLQAFAHGGACRSFLDEAFRRDGQSFAYQRFRAYGTVVTARDPLGHRAFSMAPDFEIEDGLDNSSAKNKRHFLMRPDAYAEQISGSMKLVFLDRGNGDEDSATLTIRRNGTADIRLNTWGVTVPLNDISCFDGHSGPEFVISGVSSSGGFGLTLYSFLIEPCRSRWGACSH
ncbi:MAG: hypothetical protein AAFO74_06800 [Pseudomonadota bacterium]